MEQRAGGSFTAAPPHAPRTPLRAQPDIEAQLNPFGVPLHATVDHPALLDALRSALAGWEGETAETRPPLRLYLQVCDTLHGADAPEPAVAQTWLRLDGAGVRGSADLRRGVARARVSPEFAHDAAALRAQVLEPLLLFLLTAAGRAPIHAAGVVAEGVALLLAGPSGSGKSCLALEAQERGLELLSDDTVYVQTHPVLRAWGIPRPVHLFPQDSAKHSGTVGVRNGKLKRAVPLAAFARAPADSIALLLLVRGSAVALHPVTPAEALAAFAHLEPGFDLRRTEIAYAVRRISAAGAWRLTLSADPAEAVALTLRHLPEIRGTAAKRLPGGAR